MFGFVVAMLIVGLIAGFLARAIVPGKDPMGVVQTVVLGIVGSYVGGFLGYVLFRTDADEGSLQPGNLIGAVIGSIIALLIYRQIKKRA